MDSQKHILVMRFSALGDVAMTIPVVYSLAEQFPEIKITYLTRPFFCDLFISKPSNLDVIPIDFKGEYKGGKGLCRLIKLICGLKVDYVADLHNVSRTWPVDAISRLLGKKVAMVDKKRSERRRMLQDKVQQESFISRYCDVFKRLGFPVNLSFSSVFDCDVNLPLKISQPSVGIAPFARYDTKIYPLEMMRQVANKLAEVGINVYLFGGRGKESTELKQWENDNTLIHSIAGEYKISDEIAIMSKLNLMVSMDSANQHLAALAGTKVLTIWGGTTPIAGFAPYGSSNDDAICLHLDCQPCSVAGLPQCKLNTKACMKGITPDAIADKIRHHLASKL